MLGRTILQILLLTGLLFCSFHQGKAQSEFVSGTVTSSDDGMSLIGVNIVIEGTNQGVITDIDGNFKIDISGFSNPVLIFSYTGYKTKKISVTPGQELEVVMEMDLMELTEVVVTAFGVEKNVKDLNYAVQQVDGEELESSNQNNMVNALAGKIAGVQITNSSGSPGASSQILVRGFTSVDETRDNQPLFVVDGIPIDNSSSFGSGNRAMDINMADVESISVLKGASAAALYGIEAANGVILITTKKGKSGKVTVDVSSTFSANTVLRTPPRQTKYMQGSRGVYDDQTTLSYGPLILPSTEIYDNIGEYLQTGLYSKTDISLSGGTENTFFYLSSNYLNESGIVPGENYERTGLLLKGNSKFRDNVSLNSSINVIRTQQDYSGFGSMYNVYRWPVNRDMSKYLNPDGSKNRLLNTDNYSPENPYWIMENNPRGTEVDRIISTNALNWKIFPELSFDYKIGLDLTYQHYKRVTSPTTSDPDYKGSIYESDRFRQGINSIALLTYEDQFLESINFSVMAGHNMQITKARSTTATGENYLNPDLDNINNMEIQKFSQSLYRKNLVGVFGEIKLDYNGTYFLSFTGRNDWSSTLSPENNSFFYPSISGGVNISEIIGPNDLLTYSKLRASWAKVGKDARAHNNTAVLEQAYTINGGFNYDYYAGNPNIVPEFTESIEIGMDSRWFGGNTRLDISYYQTNSFKQIISSRISPTSGWIILTFNQGSISNKGIELFLEQELISRGKWTWTASANLSRNKTKLIDLPSFVSKLYITSGQVISSARPSSNVGHPLMGIEGTTYLRNENGDIVVDENGYPRIGNYAIDENGDYILNADGSRLVDSKRVYLGDRQPEMIAGITNSFDYREFSLSFLFDFRLGGKVLNATKAVMIAQGSAGYLEDYLNKEVVFNGVVEEEGAFRENTESIVLNQSYFTSNYISVGENFVEDASWAKLRYVTFSYILPEKFSTKIGADRLTLKATGRNLIMFTKYSGGDPETNYQGASIGGSGTAGLDYFNVPNVKGFDFSINATF